MAQALGRQDAGSRRRREPVAPRNSIRPTRLSQGDFRAPVLVLRLRLQKPLSGPAGGPPPREKSREPSQPAGRSCPPGIRSQPVRRLGPQFTGHPADSGVAPLGCGRLHGGCRTGQLARQQRPGLLNLSCAEHVQYPNPHSSGFETAHLFSICLLPPSDRNRPQKGLATC